MRLFAVLFLFIFTAMTFLAPDAEARRFGGGTSIGKQRTLSAPAQHAPAAAPAPVSPAQPVGNPQPSGNRWLGPLAGLALGAGLGALLAGSGLGGGGGALIVILLVVMAVMSLVVLMAKKQQPAVQYAGMGSAPIGEVAAPASETVSHPGAATNVPADFPRESFLRSVKTSFIRLQAANDRKDLHDIREYTTPEIYAEIAMQMQERGDAPQKTEVASVDAELLEVVNEGSLTVASVRLHGQITENGGTAEAFDEIWHMHRDAGKPGALWLLAGIQQI